MNRLKAFIPPSLRSRLAAGRDELLTKSLRAAAREQGLWELAQKLRLLAGDLTEQYTEWKMGGEYLLTKLCCQHAFQVALAGPALPQDPGTVVDIGDSAGTHTRYLQALHPDRRARYLSVNLDPAAVEKIQAKGLKALLARAEDLARRGIKADVFLLFETLEHLPDPFNFLHDLSTSGCQRLVLTVPYVRRSRLGLEHIREEIRDPRSAERVHLLELSPEDLRLLFWHTGWRIVTERIYLQYPAHSPLRATKPLWSRWDYEGFYGAILAPDDRWSKLYLSWP